MKSRKMILSIAILIVMAVTGVATAQHQYPAAPPATPVFPPVPFQQCPPGECPPLGPPMPARGNVLTPTRVNMSLVQTTQCFEGLQTFARVLDAAGVTNVLGNNNPYTVFAPTNHAFQQLPCIPFQNLLTPQRRNDLLSILNYHVVPGRVNFRGADEIGTMKLTTLQGERLTVREIDGTYFINNSVIHCSYETDNGMLYAINTVLIPTGGEQEYYNPQRTAPCPDPIRVLPRR
jgi:uncharacterized surface protein with fasciclin (FAS1) repeats